MLENLDKVLSVRCSFEQGTMQIFYKNTGQTQDESVIILTKRESFKQWKEVLEAKGWEHSEREVEFYKKYL